MRSAQGRRCDLGLEMCCASLLCLLRSLKALSPTALPTSGTLKSWPNTFCRCSARRRRSSSSRCLSHGCREGFVCLVVASQANEQQRPLTLRTNTLKARNKLLAGHPSSQLFVPTTGYPKNEALCMSEALGNVDRWTEPNSTGSSD